MSSRATGDGSPAPAEGALARAHLLRFGVVGVLATGVYLLATWLLQQYAGAPVAVAASIAFVIVVAMNYLLHYSWTFRSTRPHVAALPRFLAVSTGGLIINFLVVQQGSRWLPQVQILVLLLGVATVVGWNYLLSRFWVFFDHRRQG